MPRRTEAQRARRASVRKMLKDASFTQVGRMYNAGKVSLSELRTYYSDVRADYVRQIKRIEKSDVSFIDKPPDLPKTSDIKTVEDIIKGIADANRFVQSKARSTITGRRQVRDKAIEKLRKRGIDFVTAENYNLYARFQKWYENAASRFKYGSQAPEVEEAFLAIEEEGATTAKEWEELFTIYREMRV